MISEPVDYGDPRSKNGGGSGDETIFDLSYKTEAGSDQRPETILSSLQIWADGYMKTE